MKPFIEDDVIAMKPFTMTMDESVIKIADFPTRSLRLGFVDLGQDKRPKTNKSYNIVSAGDDKLDAMPIPNSQYKKLDLDLYAFYVDDLPDFWSKRNEGFLKISANTRDPNDLNGIEKDATLATNFKVKDGNYAPAFLYRGVFRNIIFKDFINLKFDLYELDSDADQYFNKVKSVINGVPEIKNLNVLKGIPYLNLATQLFESIITTFGKNPDDHIWGEIPIMDLNPIIGGAFLRNGIYIIYEAVNSKNESVSITDIEYLNERITLRKESKKSTLSNHLIFGAQINSHIQ